MLLLIESGTEGVHLLISRKCKKCIAFFEDRGSRRNEVRIVPPDKHDECIPWQSKLHDRLPRRPGTGGQDEVHQVGVDAIGRYHLERILLPAVGGGIHLEEPRDRGDGPALEDPGY